MSETTEPDPHDPFYPPAIPTLVRCLHCGQEYDSYQIEWRVRPTANGTPRGFWCCPTSGCDGAGFGFDILPVDPYYRDERGGWFDDDEEPDFAPPDDDISADPNTSDGDDSIPY